MNKPVIYIASPYTKGDVAVNVRISMEWWDRLMLHGKVWPVAPLWSHFQHLVFPRPYADWIEYDKALIPLYDGCLRLPGESSGADGEVELFKQLGKPVFYDLVDLYTWIDGRKS